MMMELDEVSCVCKVKNWMLDSNKIAVFLHVAYNCEWIQYGTGHC